MEVWAPSAAGLLIGGATFVVVNTWLDSRVARQTGDPDDVPACDEASRELSGAEAEQSEKIRDAASGDVSGAVAFALLAAATLDGVPENLAMGGRWLATKPRGGGGTLALLVAIFASNFPESLVGAVAVRAAGRSVGFAIGVWSVAAVLLNTLMPEAFEHGRPFNSFATAAGFFVAFVLATI